MYRRLMYGLDNYSKQERAEMSTDVLAKIIRNYQKAQKNPSCNESKGILCC